MENNIVEMNQQGSAVVAQQGGAVTPMELLRHAMDAGADLDRLERLMDLQDRYEANLARKAFAEDMAKFKENPPTIYKDKHVDFKTDKGRTQYDHATIGNVTELIVEALARHGFSHRWVPTQRDGQVIVTCVITHRLGYKEETTLQSAPDTSGGKNGIQSIMSAQTYLQRHSLLAAVGLATKDQIDDDGAGTGSEPAPDVAQWIAKANAAPTGKDLSGVWEAGAPKFEAVGDDAGRTQFLAAVEARKVAIVAAKAGGANKSSRINDIVGKAAPQEPQQ